MSQFITQLLVTNISLKPETQNNPDDIIKVIFFFQTLEKLLSKPRTTLSLSLQAE